MNENNSNDLQTIITQVIEEMKSEQGHKFDLNKINLAELERRTGMTRAQLRRLQKNGFRITPHALTGRKADTTIISGYTGVIDDLLRKGVSNSEVILERIQEQGYAGSLTTVKRYISTHKDLIPPRRQAVAPQGNRGRRYSSDAGESYQMDWGFVNVDTGDGDSYKVACFAMICHHCGERYIEFFPNAKQENLFIGMIHAFKRMGVPEHVLTDNMKSVVIHRDSEGHPVWNHDYEAFMNTIGFETKLCRPRHPFTKGAVERLVRFVKENFLAGRVFGTITDLNYEAWKWCDNQNNRYHKAVDCIPHERHSISCMKNAAMLKDTFDVRKYLCPIRCISFDGFVTYEGRRFGVPYSYVQHTCRVQRENFTLYIYDLELRKVLITHDVTWSRKDSFCKGQFADDQPEEKPSVPVKICISQKKKTHRNLLLQSLLLEVTGMNETLIEQIQTDVSALDIKITAQEIALYLSEKKVPPEHLEAMKEFIAYLRQNQRDKAINALLQHSRIPQKEPSTFENFDFSRITGENAVQIRNLPNLTALYSRQNIAFIGPPGVGKTHLSMAYGNSCCRKGLRAYFIKATELNEKFTKARRTGTESSAISGLVRPSCLIIDEIGRSIFDMENTRLFFDMIDRRCSKEGPNCIIFTSNLTPDKWRDFFREEDALLCALDRTFDAATVYLMKGESYRGRNLKTYSIEISDPAE